MPELDSVRGVAIGIVVLYHALYASYVKVPGDPVIRHVLVSITAPGYLGVNLFFALSGFLITGILLDGRDRTSALRSFYERRARRLLPALVLILAAVAATGLASWAAVAGSALFLANLLPLVGISNGYQVLWSLGVEEQFYLLWPQLIRRVSPRLAAFGAGLIFLSQPVLRAFAYGHVAPNGILFYTWFNLDGLALGALLAIVVRSGVTRAWLSRSARVALAGSIIVLALGTPFGILSRHHHLGASLFLTLTSITFVAWIALRLLAGSSRARRSALGSRPIRALRYLGRISYGLYLVHLLCFDLYDWAAEHFFSSLRYTPTAGLDVVLLRTVLGTALAVVLASISRSTIEQRFLRPRPSGAP